MPDITEMNIPDLNDLVDARIEDIEKRNKAEEASRQMERQLKKNS